MEEALVRELVEKCGFTDEHAGEVYKAITAWLETADRPTTHKGCVANKLVLARMRNEKMLTLLVSECEDLAGGEIASVPPDAKVTPLQIPL